MSTDHAPTKQELVPVRNAMRVLAGRLMKLDKEKDIGELGVWGRLVWLGSVCDINGPADVFRALNFSTYVIDFCKTQPAEHNLLAAALAYQAALCAVVDAMRRRHGDSDQGTSP